MNSNKYIPLLSLLLFFGIVTQSQCQDLSHLIPDEYKLTRIVIDAGHGGYDLGAVGLRLKEKDVNLQIALQLQQELSRLLPDVQIYQTRNGDEFIGLQERKNYAKQMGADLFISIHCSTGDKDDYGSGILYLGMNTRETIMKEAIRKNNSILLEDNYSYKYSGFDPSEVGSYSSYYFTTNYRTNQSKQAANSIANIFRSNQRVGSVNQAALIILNQNQFPSIVVQVGNIVNSREEKLLSSSGISSIASQVSQGIYAYKSILDAEAKKILDRKQEEIARLKAEKERQLELERIRKAEEEAKAKQLAEEKKRREEQNWAWPSMRIIDLSGTNYFVQLTMNRDYTLSDFPYDNMVMSYIKIADQYKYLVGPFNTKEEAQTVHKEAQAKGYRSAFLLTYENGKIVR